MEGRSLLISDVDGTLLGCDAGLNEFAHWYAENQHAFRLVYNSGRFACSITESIAESMLPTPDAIIGGVGTEIYLSGSDEPLPAWTQALHPFDAHAVRIAALAHKELESQPEKFQSRYKVSFFGYDLTPAFLELLHDQLGSLGHRVQIVYSSQRDLDILPERADKGRAAVFLANYWQVPPERVYVCGDSANDASMFKHGFRGIVVGNGHAELKSLHDPTVFKAVATHAQGVLEGLAYWRRPVYRAPSSHSL